MSFIDQKWAIIKWKWKKYSPFIVFIFYKKNFSHLLSFLNFNSFFPFFSFLMPFYIFFLYLPLIVPCFVFFCYNPFHFLDNHFNPESPPIFFLPQFLTFNKEYLTFLLKFMKTKITLILFNSNKTNWNQFCKGFFFT